MLSALKNFGVTFLIAALLFGILAYFALGFVTSTMNSLMNDEADELSEIMQNEEGQLAGVETAPGQAQSPADADLPEGESFNFLVITTDYRPDLYDNYKPTLEHMYMTDWYSVSSSDTRGCLSGEYREAQASSIVLVRVDKEAKEYTYTYFSPETQVYTTTGHHTLAEVYGLYGRQTIADHLHAMTGCRINYTLLLNAYNFDEFIGICGAPTITLAKDIYQDAELTYTTQFETTVERVGDDGYPWTEHIPNTLVLPAGEIELTAETFDILNSVSGQNPADAAAKEVWTVDILKAYIGMIGTREDLKPLLAQLITKESEWGNIEGLVLPEPEVTEPEAAGPDAPEGEEPGTEEPAPEPAEPDAPSEDEPYNPWEDTGGESSSETPSDTAEGEEAAEETEAEETVNRIWLLPMAEPEGPVLETDYTMNDFDAVRELLAAADDFENITVSYPGEFVEAKEDAAPYFDPDLDAGLKKFQQYRK